MNQNVVSYLRDNKDKFPQENLIDQLRKTGYTEQDIQEGMSLVYSENPAAPIPANVEYAGFWVRFAAVFVDGLVLLIPTAIINAIFGKDFGGFLGWILAWAYAIYMLNTKQATLGKMAVGLKVTSTDGSKPTLGKLFIREILGKILNLITICIGYLMIAFTKKKQGLHDKLANTVVIYDPARKRRPWIVVISIIFFFFFPIILVASITLMSLNSTRTKVQEAVFKAEASSTVSAMLIACNDKNKITIEDLGSPTYFDPAVAIKTLKYNCNPEDEENWGFSITIDGIKGLESKSATCTENGCEFNE